MNAILKEVLEHEQLIMNRAGQAEFVIFPVDQV